MRWNYPLPGQAREVQRARNQRPGASRKASIDCVTYAPMVVRRVSCAECTLVVLCLLFIVMISSQGVFPRQGRLFPP